MSDLRQRIAHARRVVVKAGSSSLTTPDGRIDQSRLELLADVIATHMRGGRQVVLVSSGAVASAIGPLQLKDRPRDLATAQAAAAVGQGILIHTYSAQFARHGLAVAQVLLTADDVGRRVHYRNAQRTLDRLLDLGVVPIVNENDTVATVELKMGDNDRLAALVAHLVHAEALVILSDVDCLYDRPPDEPGAQPVRDVEDADALGNVTVGGSVSRVGSGGMRTKVAAARIATGAAIPVVVTSPAHADEALLGEPVGTLFHPTGKRRPTRLLWLEHATEVQGTVYLDAGAVAAVVERGASLLPAGVTAIEGDFDAGDPVVLVDPTGRAVARGISSYSSRDVPRLLGRSTRDLAAEFGSAYERELIHRDDLVLVAETPDAATSSRQA